MPIDTIYFRMIVAIQTQTDQSAQQTARLELNIHFYPFDLTVSAPPAK